MRGKSKFIAGLLLGAAAGAAVALFLQTEKGKAILNDIKDAATDAEAELKSHLQELKKQFVTSTDENATDTSSSV